MQTNTITVGNGSSEVIVLNIVAYRHEYEELAKALEQFTVEPEKGDLMGLAYKKNFDAVVELINKALG